MNRKMAVFLLLMTALISVRIIAQKKEAKMMYTHDFPKEMSAEVKASYVKLFEKGRVLYQVNCSACHDSTVNGVTLMPAFTKEHLAQYELRVQNEKHEESLSEMRVNAEELQNIMIFLTYYKKVETSPANAKQ